jgi:hypothetical protein
MSCRWIYTIGALWGDPLFEGEGGSVAVDFKASHLLSDKMGNKASCCGPANSIIANESNISTSQSGWKLLVKHELKGSDLEETLNWPKVILSAVRQFTPIRSEKSFVAFSRWYDFLSLSSSDPALQYNPLSHPPGHNFFDFLTEDFQCPDNPVGLVIVAFSQGFIADFHDSAQDLLNEPGGADSLYAKMLDSIAKFKALAYKLICEFYKNVAAVVQYRLEDAEALLYTFVLQGEVYRLLYTVACAVKASSSHAVKQAIETYRPADASDWLGLVSPTSEVMTSSSSNPDDQRSSKDSVRPGEAGLDQSVKSIRLLGASESPFEKAFHLDSAVESIHRTTEDAETRVKMLALAVMKSKLSTVLAHTTLMEAFVGVKRAEVSSGIKAGVELIERLVKEC